MRRLYLRDCAPGDIVEDVFVLTNKQLSATTTGKHFIKAFCSDKTAQVTARIWNATRELFNGIPDGGFVRLRGRIENYQNNLQLIIEQLWPAKEGTFDPGDLLPHTPKDIDEMCQRFFAICGTIHSKPLAALVQAFLDDEDLMNNFAKAPAAMNFHHAYVGGLLEHTLNAMEVGDAICKFYPGLSRDLVLAGIFLHDLAKTWELSYDCSFGYTDGGQLIGHIVKSAMWVDEKAKIAQKYLGQPLPQDLINVIQHIILSHHGEPEFGAARIPSTPEAIAVHMIENLDAKLMMALTCTRGEGASNAEGNWTEYMKAFNGRLYRPDVTIERIEIAVEENQTVEPRGNGSPDNRPSDNRPSGNGTPSDAKPPANAMRQNSEHRTPPSNGPKQSRQPEPVHSSDRTRQPDSKSMPITDPGKVVITNPLFERVPPKK